MCNGHYRSAARSSGLSLSNTNPLWPSWSEGLWLMIAIVVKAWFVFLYSGDMEIGFVILCLKEGQ